MSEFLADFDSCFLQSISSLLDIPGLVVFIVFAGMLGMLVDFIIRFIAFYKSLD